MRSSIRVLFHGNRSSATAATLRNLAAVVLFASGTSALAAPVASVALDTAASGCEFGRLRVTTAGISGGRQFWRATWNDAVTHDFVLGQGETAGPSDGYSGTLDFPFLTGPVPFGIAITLYGYQGSTPPTAATTAEFSVTYVCDSQELLASSAGPYGTITATSPANYEGLWWKAPAASESGWGINLAHQGDVIFATWFTYDAAGKAWWLSMTANKSGDATYTGTLYETHGPPFDAMPFDPARVARTALGVGALSFTTSNDATFAYTVNRVSGSKPITRQVFGVLPTCVFDTQGDPAQASNFQDLWYAAPADSEPGWGVNLTHQGDIIFATWFTYDAVGLPLWLSATAPRASAGRYAGTLYRTTGPPFDAAAFDPAGVTATPVGTLTINFADGNTATFAYTVSLDGVASSVAQSRRITREVFRPPGTLCH